MIAQGTHIPLHLASLEQDDRIIASCNDVLPSILFSGSPPEGGGIYVCGETLGGGAGAMNDVAGMNAIHVHCTNTLNLPTESLENEFPLLVEEYALVTNSGGAGRQRRGLGIARQFKIVQDNSIFNCRSESHKQGAVGVDGGQNGGTGRLVRNHGQVHVEFLTSKVAGIVLNASETIRIETPGGGGFGDPKGRTVEALASDLRDAIVSLDVAQREYGLKLVERAVALHGLATKRSRFERCESNGGQCEQQ